MLPNFIITIYFIESLKHLIREELRFLLSIFKNRQSELCFYDTLTVKYHNNPHMYIHFISILKN